MPNHIFGPGKIIDRLALQAGITLKSQFDVDSAAVIISLFKCGDCHGFLPTSGVANLAEKGKLVIRSVLPKMPRWTLILEKNKRMHIVAINAVEEIIKREIKFIIEIGLWKAGLRPEMKKGFSLV